MGYFHKCPCEGNANSIRGKKPVFVDAAFDFNISYTCSENIKAQKPKEAVTAVEKENIIIKHVS